MTKLLTTKQVRVDTDYMHFATFWFGEHIFQPACITTKENRSNMIDPSLHRKLNGLKNYTPYVSAMPRIRPLI